ncbi:MAG: biotin--[acetyl-CoA-carboxylase] ligase [Woeseia sp.]
MSTLLSEAGIRETLAETAREQLDELVVLDIVPSTNNWLLEQKRPAIGRFKAVLAEQQTAGRGRHGKRWASPRDTGLYLSVGYTFRRTPDDLACMTLAAGVATLQALELIGAERLGLKWPNDIFAKDAKLGGILVDAQTGRGGHVSIVCGIGINVDLTLIGQQCTGPANADYEITDLKSHCGNLPARSATAGTIIRHVMQAISVFETNGLGPFRADWKKYDWLKGKPVDVDMPGEEFEGVADGIDEHGALHVRTPQGMRVVHTGTVRARKDNRA